VRLLLDTANVVPSSLILVSLMIEALCSSETSVLTRSTVRNIPDDGILHSHRRENLKSYIAFLTDEFRKWSNMYCDRRTNCVCVQCVGMYSQTYKPGAKQAASTSDSIKMVKDPR
jgi:hypothetical protein